MKLQVSLPGEYGSALTAAEVIYLRDVLRAEFDTMVTPVDNPRLRGAWLFRRVHMNVRREIVWAVLQDGTQNVVATLTR